MAPADDKRDTHRLQILGDLRGEVTVFQPMGIKEISRGGAQVETAFPLQLDSLHDFRLTLGDRSIVVKGRVVHCSITDIEEELVLYRSGIEFIEPAERVAAAISSFIDAVETGRRALSSRSEKTGETAKTAENNVFSAISASCAVFSGSCGFFRSVYAGLG